MEIKPTFEIIRGEGLKNIAELALSGLSKHRTGERLIESYAFGSEGRTEAPELVTNIAGIEFTNPIAVGAGWDKKGRAINGLYHLGFSGVEVGTVPLFGQPGNTKPRLWTPNRNHDVGLNRLGFNSPGSEAVERYLDATAPFLCPVGINVGKNKQMTDEQSPWAHAEVVKQLYTHANYFVLNPSSPNTPGLRDLQKSEPAIKHIRSMKEAMDECGGQKPLFIKIAPDLKVGELNEIIKVAVDEHIAGIIVANTTSSDIIKAKYGRQNEIGGISGNEWEYRYVALAMCAEIYEQAGDELEIIGVGAISNTEHALERLLAGASLLQVVTGIREHNGKVAAQINTGILEWMNRRGYKNISEIIGLGTKRGVKNLQNKSQSQNSTN